MREQQTPISWQWRRRKPARIVGAHLCIDMLGVSEHEEAVVERVLAAEVEQARGGGGGVLRLELAKVP